MLKRFLIVAAGLVVAIAAVVGWKIHQERQRAARASEPPPPATVAVTEATLESWRPAIRSVGSLVATQQVLVSAEVPGMVVGIDFESGLEVEKGDLLVQLDDQVDRADLAGLTAERQLARIQLERMRALVEESSVPQADYDEAQADLESIEARVAAKKALIEKKAIRAPFSGVLGIRRVNLGQYLDPGAEVVSLQALVPLYVDYSVPEKELSRLEEGMTIELEVRASPDRTFEGSISAISPRVEVATRGVPVRGTVPNDDGLLRPGMFANVRTLLPAREGLVVVPRTAITFNPYGDSVFVVEDRDGELVAERRQVTTGETRQGLVEVVDGLEEGERVVEAGHVKLRSGQRVRIDNSVKLEEDAVLP